jgi:hypothetical protein
LGVNTPAIRNDLIFDKLDERVPDTHDLSDVFLHSEFGVFILSFCDRLACEIVFGVVGGKLPENVFFSDKRLPVEIISESH